MGIELQLQQLSNWFWSLCCRVLVTPSVMLWVFFFEQENGITSAWSLSRCSFYQKLDKMLFSFTKKATKSHILDYKVLPLFQQRISNYPVSKWESELWSVQWLDGNLIILQVRNSCDHKHLILSSALSLGFLQNSVELLVCEQYQITPSRVL